MPEYYSLDSIIEKQVKHPDPPCSKPDIAKTGFNEYHCYRCGKTWTTPKGEEK